MYYLKNRSLHKLFDAKISLKLISRKHSTWCTVVLETSQNYFFALPFFSKQVPDLIMRFSQQLIFD